MNQINEFSLRSKITIALDENLLQLKESLRSYGFKVITFKAGSKDPELFHLLQGMAILTKNVDDFKIDAVIHDFDIISIKNIKFIDDDKTDKNATARLISNAIRESEFYNKRGNWLLTIMNDGSYGLKLLV